MQITARVNQKKRIVLIALIGILLAGILFLFIPSVHARPDDGPTEPETQQTQQPPSFSDTYMETLLMRGGSLSTLGLTNAAFGSEVMNIADKVMRVMLALALAWTFAVFLYSFFKDMAFGDGSSGMVIKLALKFVITFMLIIALRNILDIIDKAGNGLILWICTANIFDMNDGLTGQKAWETLNTAWGTNFAYAFIMLYLRIVYYGLLIELVVRRMLMSFIIGSIADQGIRSPGFKYIKRYFAVYMKIVLLFVIFAAALQMAWDKNVMVALLIIIAACGFMGKAGQFVDEILGQ